MNPLHSTYWSAFELDGQAFTAFNGGPVFKFNEAISFQVNCQTQDEVDYSWQNSPQEATRSHSSAAGSRTSTASRGRSFPGSCSINDADYEKTQRVTEAMLRMKKIDIDALKRVYAD